MAELVLTNTIMVGIELVWTNQGIYGNRVWYSYS